MPKVKKVKPKEIRGQGKVWIQFPDQCKSCGLCIELCPKKCLKWDKQVVSHFLLPTVQCDIEQCIQCKICENMCPDMAIRVKD